MCSKGQATKCYCLKIALRKFSMLVNLSGRDRDRPGLQPQFLWDPSAVVSQGFEDLGAVVSEGSKV